MEAHKIEGLGDVRNFVLAGNAVFTLRNPLSGNRFTFRVREKTNDMGSVHFVNVLTGPQNMSDYARLGMIFSDGRFVVPSKWNIGKDAPSARAFAWFWERASAGRVLTPAEVWHEGRCGRCGKPLTVPESISLGLGPTCAGK